MAGSGCCGGAACSCVIYEGDHISITGVGSPQDPFVISMDYALEAADNSVFDVTIGGTGVDTDPYELGVAFAPAAQFADLPQVSDTAATNGQVLGWNSTTGQWEPKAPTTAAAGSVNHDNSLNGDGSVGSVLAVRHAAGRYTQTNASGVGLTDTAISSLVLRFASAGARTAALTSPVVGQLTSLDTAPGLLDYWSGTSWLPHEPTPVVSGGPLLTLSGAYDSSKRVRTLVKQLSVTTDSAGLFTLLDNSDFGTALGVLSVTVQPTGSVMFAALATAQAGFIQGQAFRLDTGDPFASQPITATVTAMIY